MVLIPLSLILGSRLLDTPNTPSLLLTWRQINLNRDKTFKLRLDSERRKRVGTEFLR